jgi:hypothetical protein
VQGHVRQRRRPRMAIRRMRTENSRHRARLPRGRESARPTRRAADRFTLPNR